MDFIIFILIASILIILFYQRVDRYTVSSSQSCSPCPPKNQNTYYISVNGCDVADCISCNSGKRIVGCIDASPGQPSGNKGACV
jgi:hypothetical protein